MTRKNSEVRNQAIKVDSRAVAWAWCTSRWGAWLLALAALTITQAVAQPTLDRTRFKPVSVFAEEFSYASPTDSLFRARWQSDFYTAVNNDWTEYASTGQLAILPGGILRMRTSRLSLAERLAATDSAASHGARRPAPGPPGTAVPGSSPWGGPIAYASGKMISRVGGSDTALYRDGPFPGFGYGLFEIRCQLPASGRGILPAFWLNGPQTEIDVMDNCNENPGRLLQSGVLNWGQRNACGGEAAPLECWTRGFQLYQYDRDLTQGFNTYSAVWTPEAVTFYLNDYYLYSVPAALVSTHREAVRLVLNVGTRGEDHFASGDMLVDYIRVWELR